MKLNKNQLLVGLLVLLIISFSVNNMEFPRPLMFSTLGEGYFHAWHFKTVTKKEYVEGPSRTIDETNFPIASNIEEVVEECKYSAIAHVTKELVDELGARGYEVNVLSVYPTVRIEQRRESRQFRDYMETTIYSTLIVDCEARFETDKPLAESPIPAWVLLLLVKIIDKLPMIIIASFVGLGLYVGITTWVNSFFVEVNEIVTEYYEEGELVKRETETTTKPSTEGFIWSLTTPIIIVVIIVVALWMFGFGKRK